MPTRGSGPGRKSDWWAPAYQSTISDGNNLFHHGGWYEVPGNDGTAGQEQGWYELSRKS